MKNLFKKNKLANKQRQLEKMHKSRERNKSWQTKSNKSSPYSFRQSSMKEYTTKGKKWVKSNILERVKKKYDTHKPIVYQNIMRDSSEKKIKFMKTHMLRQPKEISSFNTAKNVK